MPDPVKYWMVTSHLASSTHHKSLQAAESEAKQLAMTNPGYHFTVMEAVAVYERINEVRCTPLRTPDATPNP